MLSKLNLILAGSLVCVLTTSIIYTNNTSAATLTPITRILTDSGYVYPDADGTIHLKDLGLSSLGVNPIGSGGVTQNTILSSPINQLDFSTIPYSVNFIDGHFSQTGTALGDISGSEPYNGTIDKVVITPKVNDYKTPLRLQLLINGVETTQIVTIPALSTKTISTILNQPFHSGDSLVWHTLDTMPFGLKMNAQAVIIYSMP